MLDRANLSSDVATSLLATTGLEFALFSPTATGLEKSIVDAIEPIRRLFRRAGIHDYSKQGQGQQHKVVIEADFWVEGATRPVEVSLYRPVTKSGDPRFWPSRLARYANPTDMIGLIAAGKRLLVVNLSNPPTRAALQDPNSELRSKLREIQNTIYADDQIVVDEIQLAASRGWLEAVRRGPTSVGMTLEQALGVAPNANRAPDYRGYEVKAKVGPPPGDHRGRSTRQTLFACVPDWSVSNAKSSSEILKRHGYRDTYGRLRLYCTISATKLN